MTECFQIISVHPFYIKTHATTKHSNEECNLLNFHPNIWMKLTFKVSVKSHFTFFTF